MQDELATVTCIFGAYIITYTLWSIKTCHCFWYNYRITWIFTLFIPMQCDAVMSSRHYN